jgi:hypothetical protein
MLSMQLLEELRAGLSDPLRLRATRRINTLCLLEPRTFYGFHRDGGLSLPIVREVKTSSDTRVLVPKC